MRWADMQYSLDRLVDIYLADNSTHAIFYNQKE